MRNNIDWVMKALLNIEDQVLDATKGVELDLALIQELALKSRLLLADIRRDEDIGRLDKKALRDVLELEDLFNRS